MNGYSFVPIQLHVQKQVAVDQTWSLGVVCQAQDYGNFADVNKALIRSVLSYPP